MSQMADCLIEYPVFDEDAAMQHQLHFQQLVFDEDAAMQPHNTLKVFDEDAAMQPLLQLLPCLR